MKDKEPSALKALADRIIETGNHLIFVSKDAGYELHSLISRLEQAEAENDKLREAVDDAALAATILRELSIKDGGINAAFSGGAAQLLAEAFGDQFIDSGATNYLEVGFNTSKGVHLLVTLQRVDGKTPAQLQHEAEEKLADVQAILAATITKPNGDADQYRATIHSFDESMRDPLNKVLAERQADTGVAGVGDVKTWQERAGYAPNAPIAPTGYIESAMLSEIADLRTQLARQQAPVSAYPLSEYAPDQWWLKELDAMSVTRETTADMVRAARVACNFAAAVFGQAPVGDSVDTPEFRELLWAFHREWQSVEKIDALIAHIDAQLARQRQDSALTEREQEIEELLRSACAIAERQGAGTAWDRFVASVHKVGLNGVTARTYRILSSDAPNTQKG